MRRRAVLVVIAALLGVIAGPAGGAAAEATCPTLDPITREPNPPAAPGVDWSGCSLAHIQLSGANLSGANLSGADLSSADITDADLSNADLSNADLTASYGPGLDLQGTALAGATLTGIKTGGGTGTPASLPTDWAFRSGHLLGPGANLSDAHITGANLSLLHLAGANLVRAIFQNSFLNGSDLTGVDLSDGSLVGSDLSGTVVDGALLKDVILSNTVLEGTSFDGATFDKIFSGGVTGSPAVLPPGWQLTAGYLVGPTANLTQAILQGADLSGADLSHANLTKADLRDADLDGADLSQAVLTGVVSGGTTGTPADLPPGWRLDSGELWFSNGVLRVVTDPPVPSRIRIDGAIADTWGLNWVQVAPGSHQVCFDAVPGFATPPCRTVDVPLDASVETTGTFVARGWLNVATSPPVASQISVDGIPRDNWGLYTDLPTGSHQVCFGAVAGFQPPSCEQVTVTAGATTSVTGTFTASPGAPGLGGVGLLRVTTTPAVPSQITVDGEIRDTWGLDWLQIPAGVHEVCFGRVEGYAEPACSVVSMTSGNTKVVDGAFTRGAHVRVFTDPPLPGTVTINAKPADAWGVYTDTNVAGVTVCFTKVPGYKTPDCVGWAMVPGGTATFTGHYVPN